MAKPRQSQDLNLSLPTHKIFQQINIVYIVHVAVLISTVERHLVHCLRHAINAQNP